MLRASKSSDSRAELATDDLDIDAIVLHRDRYLISRYRFVKRIEASARLRERAGDPRFSKRKRHGRVRRLFTHYAGHAGSAPADVICPDN